MRELRRLTCLIAVASVSITAQGMWMFDETKTVPIERLFTNLQQRLAKDTDSFELTYQLARLHSMAYSTNRVEFEVSKKDGKPVFGLPV